MDIGLIDADLLDGGTRFPNLAIMKISGYYKAEGYNTKLINYNDIPKHEKVYVSKVFDKTKIPVNLDFYGNIQKGGTGFDFDKETTLPHEIEHSMPDYKLYKDYTDLSKYYSNHSIGFTTRFCFRGCNFCVNRNKDKVIRWSPIEEFHNENNKYITLLDDNILGHKDRVDILNQLRSLNIPFEYKQGLDLRLMNDEIAYILNNSKYAGEFIFAFDDINDKKQIIEKINLWKKYNKQIIKLYVLCGYDREGSYTKKFWVDDIVSTLERIRILMEYNCLPYIMRYKEYKNSKWRGIYTTIARWCNQPAFYKKMSFIEFCKANGNNSAAMRYLKEFKNEYPDIANEYFNMKYELKKSA